MYINIYMCVRNRKSFRFRVDTIVTASCTVSNRESRYPHRERNTCFSSSRIVALLPVQKSFVQAGPKCDVFREGWDKNVISKKKIRVRERHILP